MTWVEVVTLIVILILYVKELHYALTLFQQEHYDKSKYVKGLPNFYLTNSSTFFYVLILGSTFLYFLLDWVWLLILVIVLAVVSFFKINKLIIPLKFTKRIIRLLITISIITIGMLTLGLIFDVNFMLSLLLLVIPFIIILSDFINLPLETYIYNHFMKMAKNKLFANHTLFKIGITGSFGKTSTKNILAYLLEDQFITLPTPFSYNTPLGIAKTINEKLFNNTEMFIIEMGAFREKEIEYLTNFTHPHIGIITEVGPQHLSTFKSIDTVLKTKMELIDSEFSPSVAIVNGDNHHITSYLKTREKEKDQRIVTVGITNEDANYLAKNIIYSHGRSSFSLYKNGKYLTDIKSKLLGKHNIYNLLLALATVYEVEDFGYTINIQNVFKRIESIPPIKNRLEYRKQGLWEVLDDSYNANLFGFSYALEVLSMSEKEKIIITPGIVDGGSALEELNQEVALKMMKVADFVYLVDNLASRSIKNCFDEANFQNYSIHGSFKKAYQSVIEKYQNQEITLLIENDLPDHFLRRKI